MSIEQKQQAELHGKLWQIANNLRGNMDPSEFKDYILGLIFYRYLSENLIKYAKKEYEEDFDSYEEAFLNEGMKKHFINYLTSKETLGYIIEPNNLWEALIGKIKNGTFEISNLANAISNFNDHILGKESEETYKDLFSDMDLQSSKLGRTPKDKGELIGKVMEKIDEIDFSFDDSKIDILGDAYEYLISQFAASAGKKAGEFYTPQQVSKLLAKIVTMSGKVIKNVYDPTCGSGSLLLQVSREGKVEHYSGQEFNSTTYNLARMNMILRNIKASDFDIVNDDTLKNPSEIHLNKRFDAIVANPPYSAQWIADPSFLDQERFSDYGKLAPKSKADFAFIQHMIHVLDDSGTMAVVLPHGVLFRGAAEGVIRKYLIENRNYLDAVIGLPSNLFFGTSIPTCVLVFKKCRENKDVFFIDASKEFESGKNQNRLTDENLDKIINTYKNRVNVDKYAYKASLEEIKENDYNLNIPRYVDTFEEEEEIDIKEVLREIKLLENQREELDKEIAVYLKELGIGDLDE